MIYRGTVEKRLAEIYSFEEQSLHTENYFAKSIPPTRVARFHVKSPVKGLKGSIRRMTKAWLAVKQCRSERFARKRRVGQFVGQFLGKIVRSLSRPP